MGNNKNQFVALLDRVVEEDKAKRDFEVPFGSLRMNNEGRILSVEKLGVSAGSELTDFAMTQLFNRSEMPVRYMKRLLNERPQLVAEQFNHWMEKEASKEESQKKVLLRSVKEESGYVVRGVLSDKYTILDNNEVLDSLVGLADGLPDFKVESMFNNDKKMHVRLSFNDLTHNFGVSPEGKNDIVKVGLDIQNSEIGYSSLVVAPITYRLVCTNGLMAWKAEEGAIRQRHVHMSSAELREMMEKSMQVSIENGKILLDGMKESTRMKIINPYEYIEEKSKEANLSNKQIEVVKANFDIEPMKSLYGVVNAFTRTARDQKNHEARLSIEKLAGSLLQAV